MALGRATEEVIELTRRHCRHARIEPVHGNSWAGSMLGLPMGPVAVRCQHAPPPMTEGHQALELAIEFYQANCIGCPHRDPTGELPSLSTVAGQRAADEAARKAAAQQAADEKAQRHHRRRERRHQLLAGEGHVVRDLADALDRIDQAEPRTGPPSPEEARAGRQVLDAARGAPELFRPVLVDSLLELAADATDPTAFEALRILVRAGRCPPRRALEAARAVLRRYRSVDAGRLLAVLEPSLTPEDLPDLLDQLISLASGEDDPDLAPVPWRRPASPEGLIAASRIDLPAVTARVIEHLASDDESTREAGADAARVLLALDATRVIALGRPLAASVRGPESGYAGYPHPTSAALRALAEAWRGEPALTRQIVEAEAAGASHEARGELSRVPWFLERFRQPWDATAAATAEAVSFVVRRAGGDWGEEAADRAARPPAQPRPRDSRGGGGARRRDSRCDLGAVRPGLRPAQAGRPGDRSGRDAGGAGTRVTAHRRELPGGGASPRPWDAAPWSARRQCSTRCGICCLPRPVTNTTTGRSGSPCSRS